VDPVKVREFSSGYLKIEYWLVMRWWSWWDTNQTDSQGLFSTSRHANSTTNTGSIWPLLQNENQKTYSGDFLLGESHWFPHFEAVLVNGEYIEWVQKWRLLQIGNVIQEKKEILVGLIMMKLTL
jgi:hypothetical protein